MKRIITYGTFDLLHYGHINLLRRAKELGDYLIVGISTDDFTRKEKEKNCYFTEVCWEQKISDVHEYHIDTFVMGNDWEGKFDYLREEGVEVIYLPRTPEISSSQIKRDIFDANDNRGTSKIS